MMVAFGRLLIGAAAFAAAAPVAVRQDALSMLDRPDPLPAEVSATQLGSAASKIVRQRAPCLAPHSSHSHQATSRPRCYPPTECVLRRR